MTRDTFKNEFDHFYAEYSNKDEDMQRLKLDYKSLFREEKPLSIICALIFSFDFFLIMFIKGDYGPLWIILFVIGLVPLFIRYGKDIKIWRKNHIVYREIKMKLIDKTMGRVFFKEGFYDRKPIDRFVFIDAFAIRYQDNLWTKALIKGQAFHNYIIGAVAGIIGLAIDNYLFPEIIDSDFIKRLVIYCAVSNIVRALLMYCRIDADFHHYRTVTKDYKEWILKGNVPDYTMGYTDFLKLSN